MIRFFYLNNLYNIDMESIDLDNLNNSSQFYLDAMEQLKKEYDHIH